MDIHPRDLAIVRSILTRHVPEHHVYAFGSRVTGNARKASDLDLAIMTKKPLDVVRRADLREAFSESDLPFKVDFLDWADIKEDFKKLILQNRLRIQTGKEWLRRK